jgi:hypothetical protein
MITDEIVTNESGGKQSRVDQRLDLFPAEAFLRVGEVLAEGAKKYAPNNWRLIPSRDHLNHCMIHIAKFLSGDTSEDHAGHAACRMMMFLEMAIAEGTDVAVKPEPEPITKI